MKRNKEMEKNLSTENLENNINKPKKKSKILAFLKSRNARKGSVAVVLTIIFIAIVFGLNVVAKMLTNNYPVLSHDMTQSNVYELTETSLEYLDNLNRDITIYVLADEKDIESQGTYYTQVNKLLHQFDTNSKHITLKYVNIMSNPTFVNEYPDINWNANSYLLLIEHGDNHIAVAQDDVFTYDEEYLAYGEYYINGQNLEQAVLTAILNVTVEDKVGVTILTGHGEIENTAINSILMNNAYDVETVNLLNAEIDEKSKFVIINAPEYDIDQKTYDTLVDWLYNDGKYGHTLLYVPNYVQSSETPNIDMLLEEWGMAVSDGLIFETDADYMVNYYEPNHMSIVNYEESDLSSTLKDQNIPVVMLYTMPVELIDTAAVSLLSSSQNAVVKPLDADENWDYNEEEPQKLCAAAMSSQGNEDNTKSSNVIVFGSFEALSQSFFSTTSFNNSQYFINIFNTISHRDDVSVTIEGKNLESAELGLTSMAAPNFLGIIFIAIVPLAVVIVGIVLWILRRHK